MMGGQLLASSSAFVATDCKFRRVWCHTDQRNGGVRVVLPLIPAAIIAVGAVTGSGGVALGGMGLHDLRKASRQLNDARERYEQRHTCTEQRVAGTNERLESWGEEQKQALTDVVLRMGEFLRRHERQVRESERQLVDGLDATIARVAGPEGLNVDARLWVGGAVASAAAAAGTNVAATTAATSIGAASTGAAISGLSGAAAKSATMAWLGGGALSAGGGGVALGATALNVLTLGPTLLVGGLMFKGQGKKAITQAEEQRAKIAVAIAELDTTDALLAAVGDRVGELSSLLSKLTGKAIPALDLLESEPFDPHIHTARFQQALALVVAVRDVAATPIIDESGELTEQSANLTVRYRAMTEETQDA